MSHTHNLWICHAVVTGTQHNLTSRCQTRHHNGTFPNLLPFILTCITGNIWIKSRPCIWCGSIRWGHFISGNTATIFSVRALQKKKLLCHCKDTFPHQVSINSCKTAIPKHIQICPSHSLVYIKSTVPLKFQCGWQWNLYQHCQAHGASCPCTYHGGTQSEQKYSCPCAQHGGTQSEQKYSCPCVHHGGTQSEQKYSCPCAGHGGTQCEQKYSCPCTHHSDTKRTEIQLFLHTPWWHRVRRDNAVPVHAMAAHTVSRDTAVPLHTMVAHRVSRNTAVPVHIMVTQRE